jgi:hypothetical protein
MAADNQNISFTFTHAVREAAGEDGLARLRALCGGREVSIPRTVYDGHVLVQALGQEAADKVCRAMRIYDADGHSVGGLRVYISLAKQSLMGKALEIVDDLLISGKSTSEIVDAIGVSNRSVTRRRAILLRDGRLVERASTVVRKPQVKIGKLETWIIQGDSIGDIAKRMRLPERVVRGRRRQLIKLGICSPDPGPETSP